MKDWYKAFLPRGSSRSVFILVMLCYETFAARVLSDIVKILHLWPTEVDPVTKVTRQANPGVSGDTILMLTLGPMIESLVLVAIIQLLNWLKVKTVLQVVIAALIFSVLHTLEVPIWGVLVLPFFLIDGATFVYWRRDSIPTAATMAIILHVLANAVPILQLIAHRIGG
jgi:hypothetical protein